MRIKLNINDNVKQLVKNNVISIGALTSMINNALLCDEIHSDDEILNIEQCHYGISFSTKCKLVAKYTYKNYTLTITNLNKPDTYISYYGNENNKLWQM